MKAPLDAHSGSFHVVGHSHAIKICALEICFDDFDDAPSGLAFAIVIVLPLTLVASIWA